MQAASTHYIFVDFENVPDIDLSRVAGKPVKVILVIGERQKNLSLELVKQVHQLHAQVELVEVGCSGKNALDLVLAHHLGRQAAIDPQGVFHILSKDKGFDSLVTHLKKHRVLAERIEVFSSIPVLQNGLMLSLEERVTQVKERLSKVDAKTRPQKLKTLTSMVHALFAKLLPSTEIESVIQSLIQSGYLAVSPEGKVSYKN